MNMNIIKTLLILIIFPIMISSSAHKFYVSTTNIEYVSQENDLQIISKIFVDDLEKTLSKRYQTEVHLGTDKETTKDLEYLKKYVFKKIKIYIDGEEPSINFLGVDYDIDMISIYLEIENVSEFKTFKVENVLLIDMFEQQQNIVHFKSKKAKRSWILDKDNPSGMLNLN